MKKGPIETALFESMKDYPRIFFKEVVVAKLKSAKIELPDDRLEEIVAQLLSGNANETLVVTSDSEQDVAICLSDEDMRLVEEKIERLSETITDTIGELGETLSEDLFRTLKENWKTEKHLQHSDILDFKSRLNAAYEPGFDLLKMILTCCRELANEEFNRLRKSKAKKNVVLRDAILRIHTRACQVMSEVIVLLESGLADGAMARWRTLYELSIVATVIYNGGDETARSYIDHQFVDAYKAILLYEKCYEDLGFRPPSKKDKARAQKSYETAIKVWGSDFKNDYGWAAKALNTKSPKFSDLETAAQKTEMRSYYKMASWTVHANARSLFFKMGSIPGETVYIAGSTNYGFTEPAQNSALSLIQLTALLLGKDLNLDNAILIQTLMRMNEETANTFLKAENKIKQRHLREGKEK